MKKTIIGLSFILTTCTIPYSGLNSQDQISSDSSNFSIPIISDHYSMRLDFMTESQVDDLIKLRKVGLDDLCDKTMGCKSRGDVILAKDDRIQLFYNERISSIELIRIDSGKKTIIASSITNKKESYIIVPEKVTQENIESYIIQIFVNNTSTLNN